MVGGPEFSEHKEKKAPMKRALRSDEVCWKRETTGYTSGTVRNSLDSTLANLIQTFID